MRRRPTIVIACGLLLALAAGAAGLARRYRVFDERAFHSHAITRIVPSEDGRWALAASDGQVKVWDLRNPLDLRGGPPKSRSLEPGTVNAIAWLDDGRTALVAAGLSRALLRWDIDSGATTPGPSCHDEGGITAIAVSGDLLATAIRGEVRVFRVPEWELVHAFGTSGAVTNVLSFSDRRTLRASGFWTDERQPAQIAWDLQTERIIGREQSDEASWADWMPRSPDGKLAVSGIKYTGIGVRDVASKRLLMHLDHDVSAVVFHPNGRDMILGHEDGRLTLVPLSSPP